MDPFPRPGSGIERGRRTDRPGGRFNFRSDKFSSGERLIEIRWRRRKTRALRTNGENLYKYRTYIHISNTHGFYQIDETPRLLSYEDNAPLVAQIQNTPFERRNVFSRSLPFHPFSRTNHRIVPINRLETDEHSTSTNA